ncbi:SagB/ThcOx family dehydrogenase [Inconstantimicrobium porci]|nr:SagB/ThcOx family dehydrogenase [Inconstantimicrobium porci]MDD6771826.1 SagB/ThcOx family dehydrogenase [Inconstantimicrobium porci]
MISDDFRGKYKYHYLNGIPLFELYHTNTELNCINFLTLNRMVNNAVCDDWFNKKIKKGVTLYNEIECIKLPAPNPTLEKYSFFETVSRRRSIRNYSKIPLSLEELSTILFYSAGISGKYDETEQHPRQLLRTYPSAGALFPINLYLFINNVEGLDKGIYYYDAINNNIKCLNKYCNIDTLCEVLSYDGISLQGACAIFMLANMELVGYKYGERGYRFINIEAGHIAQNFYLVSTAIGIGTVALGGFLDEELLELLPLDREKYFMLYQLVIGNINFNSDYWFPPSK